MGPAEAKRDEVPGLGAKLRELRVRAGIKATVLASDYGLSQPAISRYETGAKTPTLAVLYKLAAAYGCNVCDLLPGGIVPRAEPPEPVAPPAPRPPARGKHK